MMTLTRPKLRQLLQINQARVLAYLAVCERPLELREFRIDRQLAGLTATDLRAALLALEVDGLVEQRDRADVHVHPDGSRVRRDFTTWELTRPWLTPGGGEA